MIAFRRHRRGSGRSFTAHPASLLLAGVFVAGSLAACGSSPPPAPVAKPAAADAGVAALGTSPPPAGLPPMAAMPPPGVRGSKKATLRAAAAPAPCPAAAKGEPSERLKTIATCNKADGLSAKSAVFTGTLGEGEGAKAHPFHAEANHCYRVYFAHEAIDAVVLVRDSAGDGVAESPFAAAPTTALMCFAAADDLTVLVSFGTGKGRYAAQVWGN